MMAFGTLLNRGMAYVLFFLRLYVLDPLQAKSRALSRSALRAISGAKVCVSREQARAIARAEFDRRGWDVRIFGLTEKVNVYLVHNIHVAPEGQRDNPCVVVCPVRETLVIDIESGLVR